MTLYERIKWFFKSGNCLSILITINIIVFCLLAISGVFSFLLNAPIVSERIIRLLSVPSSLPILLRRWWTIITYMFTHQDIWHILFNMLWLYWFGQIFLQYFDQRKLTSTYLIGGIAGALTYVIGFNIFPVFADQVLGSIAIGASASVMAVVFAIAVYMPDYQIRLLLLGRVKIIWVAAITLILTSFMDFSTNSGGKLAHIGGAFYGYLFAVNIRQGKDIGEWINRIIDFFVTLFKTNRGDSIFYKRSYSDNPQQRGKKEKRQTTRKRDTGENDSIHQKEIDNILDKIAKGGYDSLTKAEKEFLFKDSKK